MRVAVLVAAAVLAAVLTGCAPDAGVPSGDVQQVEVEGRISEITASNGGSESGYLLDVAGQGYLSIAVEGAVPMDVRGVVVEVSADAEIPVDSAGEFAALTAIVEQSGDPLHVVDFLR